MSTFGVVLVAAVAGFIGFFVGQNIANRTFFYAAATPAAIGAGVGWIVGAAAGVAVTRGTRPRRRESLVLFGIAALFLAAGFTFRSWASQIEGVREETVNALQLAVRLDAGVAAVTCIALALPRGVPRVIGAIVAVGIAVASVVLFAAGPCSLQTICDY